MYLNGELDASGAERIALAFPFTTLTFLKGNHKIKYPGIKKHFCTITGREIQSAVMCILQLNGALFRLCC